MKKDYEKYMVHFGVESPAQEKRSWDLANIKQKIKIEQQKEAQNEKQILEYEKVIREKERELRDIQNGIASQSSPDQPKNPDLKLNKEKPKPGKFGQLQKKISTEITPNAEDLLAKKMKENEPVRVRTILEDASKFIWDASTEKILKDLVYEKAYDFEAVGQAFQARLKMKNALEAEELRLKFSSLYSGGENQGVVNSPLKEILKNKGDTFEKMRSGKVSDFGNDFEELD